jgi:hypothetical protein
MTPSASTHLCPILKTDVIIFPVTTVFSLRIYSSRFTLYILVYNAEVNRLVNLKVGEINE